MLIREAFLGRREATRDQRRSPAPGHTRFIAWTAALALLLLVSIIATIGIGVVSIPVSDVVRTLHSHVVGGQAPIDPKNAAIIWNIRTPRTLLALTVGAALSITGVSIQAVLRNLLADPYLIGVSSGASTGAALVILGFASSTSLSLTLGAFLGSTVAIVLVFAIARVGGPLTAERFIFAGIIVGFAMNALTDLLVFITSDAHGARSVLFWTLGSFNLADWESLPIPLSVLLATLLLLSIWARRFDAMAIGDDTARTLGTDPALFRIESMILAALCVSTMVAVSGTIGFVGLVVPHISRRLVGALHRRVLIVSALLGSVLLMWSDTLARSAFQPNELPVGVLTALLGTPLLLFLMRKLYAN